MIYKVISKLKHNGHEYQKGDEVELTDGQAEILIGSRVVENIEEPPEDNQDSAPGKPDESQGGTPSDDQGGASNEPPQGSQDGTPEGGQGQGGTPEQGPPSQYSDHTWSQGLLSACHALIVECLQSGSCCDKSGIVRRARAPPIRTNRRSGRP